MFQRGYLMTEKSPIVYLFCKNTLDGPQGYTTPGWYFWDEIWCNVYGPYESVEETKKQLAEYAETI